MPAIHSVKLNLKDAFYHVYNRGTNKKLIFKDLNDYRYFIKLLNRYLSKTLPILDKYTNKITQTPNIRYIGNKLEIHAYCLMPNHIHFLLKQLEIDGMKSFMARLSISYAMYFNKKYNSSGRLFQGIYKARLIKSQTGLNNITQYIHENPIELTGKMNYQWSSYKYYKYQYDKDFITKRIDLFQG